MERGLAQREGRAQRQLAFEIGHDHALMARSALQCRWLEHVRVCGGYLPQNIPYNEFREAPGITCAADLSYQGEVRGPLCNFNSIMWNIVHASVSSKLSSKARSLLPRHSA